MSLVAMIRTRGATVTVRRQTEGNQASDGSAVSSWADASTGVKLLEAHKGAELAQRVFGRETQIDVIGRAERSSGIRQGDVLVITAAGYPEVGAAADRYRVTAKVDHAVGGSGHVELALAKAQATEGA